MRDQTTTASAHEVIAVEPVIRRVVAARAMNSADVDDLVQDCLERLLVARERLAPEAVLPYAVVIARNLVASHAKGALRHAAAAPRILDPSEPERPDEALLARETRDAMMVALARLSDQERSDILAYYSDGSSGTQAPPSRGALRVRMARTRAKLRLEYLLAFRRLELPSAVCRSVLLAISAGDTRRQRELNAGQHLLDCQVCATLSEPLDRRSMALTAITIPGGLAAWALGKARAHPAQATAAVAAGSAAVAAAVTLGPQLSGSGPAQVTHALVSSAPASPAHAQRPSVPAPRASELVISHLSVAGRTVSDAEARQSLRSLIGRAANASGATVVAAVTRNGFWIGSSRARVWVQLVGPLRPLRIRAGDRVRFTGIMVGTSPSYPALAGVSGGDAALLARQGAHLAVSTTRISVER
ncbi:MAG: sigma-70 family RNA polymerase sigma factor [Actinobacteria bacterium]|nr:sigma-70 family RNA polymerase sigma factor [Actinomycetota bacterium]